MMLQGARWHFGTLWLFLCWRAHERGVCDFPDIYNFPLLFGQVSAISSLQFLPPVGSPHLMDDQWILNLQRWVLLED